MYIDCLTVAPFFSTHTRIRFSSEFTKRSTSSWDKSSHIFCICLFQSLTDLEYGTANSEWMGETDTENMGWFVSWTRGVFSKIATEANSGVY
jgi:hypothetical protein